MKAKTVYAIKNKNGEYWSNDFGWIELEEGDENTFSIFTKTEKENFNLPLQGRWIKL